MWGPTHLQRDDRSFDGTVARDLGFALIPCRLSVGTLGMAGLSKDDRAASPSDDALKKMPVAKRRRADATGGNSEPEIGRALRSVYDETVSEAIPSEMLDLLGRLD